MSLGGTPAQASRTTVASKKDIRCSLLVAEDPGVPGQEQRRHPRLQRDPAKNEVFVDSATTFIGYAQPQDDDGVHARRGAAPTAPAPNGAVRFPRRSLHLERHRADPLRQPRQLPRRRNPDAPISEQARAVALRDNPSHTLAGYHGKGRLREAARDHGDVYSARSPARRLAACGGEPQLRGAQPALVGERTTPASIRTSTASPAPTMTFPDQFQTLACPRRSSSASTSASNSTTRRTEQ